MKKKISRVLGLTALLLIAACSGNNRSTSSNSDKTSSNNDTSSSVALSSSQNNASSKNNSSSAEGGYKLNELKTQSGLTVKFKANGATIDSIKWNNTQIATDGFTVGRCANRIAQGKFTLNGTQYNLTINNNGNHLHGGNGSGWNSWRGPFATQDWVQLASQDQSSVIYKFNSPDGDNGYPGNMEMIVKYSLSEEGELSIEYSATTDKDTLCNPTNHLFMTMNGNSSYDNIKLQINADNYTPLNSNSIPTGAISPVAGTKYDYREETAFKKDESYDDNYVTNGTGYRKVASMTGTSSKIKVDVYTDRPGLQLYKESNGKICLETQMLPDAINHPEFDAYGTTILRAGETFTSKTTYAFSKVA